MNTNELKGKRVRKGFNQDQMAAKLNMAVPTYNRKENAKGGAEFTTDEIKDIARILDLTAQDVNVIFFDGQLGQLTSPLSELGKSA